MPVWFSDALGSAAAVLDDALDQDRQRGASGDQCSPVVDSDAFRREVLSTIGEGWRLLLLVGYRRMPRARGCWRACRRCARRDRPRRD